MLFAHNLFQVKTIFILARSSNMLLNVQSNENVSSKSKLRLRGRESKLKRSPSKESVGSMVSQDSSASSVIGGSSVTQFDQVL